MSHSEQSVPDQETDRPAHQLTDRKTGESTSNLLSPSKSVVDLEALFNHLAEVSPNTMFDGISDEDLQRIITGATIAFAARHEEGALQEPFGRPADVTATDVAILASAMLRAVNVQVFELGLWQSFNG